MLIPGVRYCAPLHVCYAMAWEKFRRSAWSLAVGGGDFARIVARREGTGCDL
jgi:hypothetical protein